MRPHHFAILFIMVKGLWNWDVFSGWSMVNITIALKLMSHIFFIGFWKKQQNGFSSWKSLSSRWSARNLATLDYQYQAPWWMIPRSPWLLNYHNYQYHESQNLLNSALPLLPRSPWKPIKRPSFHSRWLLHYCDYLIINTISHDSLLLPHSPWLLHYRDYQYDNYAKPFSFLHYLHYPNTHENQ